jgi:hypothetical protein
VLGTPPQPTAHMCDARPAVPVGADRSEDPQGCAFLDALDGRQVDARQARESRAGIAPGRGGLRGSASLGRQGVAVALVGKGLEMGVDLWIADGELLVREGRECDGLASGQQVRGAPGALPRLRDVVRIVVAVRVAQRREGLWIALARHESFDNGHAGGAGDVTDAVGACEGHLRQGLWPVLHRLGSRGAQPVAVAPGATQHAALRRRPPGASEQPVGRQALPPLASKGSGCGPSGSALDVAGINQQDLETTRLPERAHGHPGDAGRCHRDRGDTAVEEPVGEGIEGGGAGAKAAHGLGDALWWHGHPVLGFAEVHAGGVGG